MTLDDRPAERAPDSSLDERLHDGALYGSYYYSHYSVPYEKNSHWTEFFGTIADRIVHELAPTTSLDAGCAIGVLVESLRARGVDAHGIDSSEWAIEHAVEGARGHCAVGSLTDPLRERYDLITCIEVIEHIPEAEVAGVVANLCSATNQLLLSSVPDDFGEATHVNVRPAEYWAALFAQYGFFHDLDYDASFVSPWAMLFRRIERDASSIVREYERTTTRLRQEVHQLRIAAVAHQAELEAAQPDHDRTEEVQALREEALGQRDRLIVAETRLGTALGDLRAAEAEIQRYLVIERDFTRLGRLPFWPWLAKYLRLESTARSRVGAITRRLGVRR